MHSHDQRTNTRLSVGLAIIAGIAGILLNADDGATVAADKTTVYSRSSITSSVVGTLEKGQSVTVLWKLTGSSGCWMEIKSQVSAGYVRCQDISEPVAKQPTYTPVAPSSPSDTKPAPTTSQARGLAPRGGAFALTHVRLIDGSGDYARQDQTIIVEGGRIREIGDSYATKLTGVSQTLDLSGDTALPGLVGMHDHLFYALPPSGNENRPMLVSFPKLYLASGVTTIRTAGHGAINAEIRLKQQIDQGREPGPRIYLSVYVDGDLRGPENPSRVAQSAERAISAGIRSIKIYTGTRPSELAAVVQSAHQLGVKVTGHLCATGFSEAAAAGIDNLEHGILVDTEFYSGRQPGSCPDQGLVQSELIRMDVRGPQIQNLIRTLVSHGVAITSTLAVFESFSAQRMRGLDSRTLPMLAPELQPAFRTKLALIASRDALPERALLKEMQFEREFVQAGGLLMAGLDPTGWGGVIAGYGDQRELELLVEAGFRPEQAIQIATSNGAQFLGEAERIGTLAAGRVADIVVVRGNPSNDIRDIENTQLVVKEGVRYDPSTLLRGLAGTVGRQ